MPQTSLMSYFSKPATIPYAAPLLPRDARAPKFAQSLRTLSKDDGEDKDVERQPEPTTANTSIHDCVVSFKNVGVKSVAEKPDATNLSSKTFSIPHAPSIHLSAITTAHLPDLKRLTSTLLPIKYPDPFFSGAVDEAIPASFSRVAVSSATGTSVGWIRCRLEPFPAETSPPSNTSPIHNQLYIQALCLLAPYRGQGIAAALLENVLAPELLRQHNIIAVYAHVWEKNDEALGWYERRGFRKIMLLESYYRRLRPGGAWVMTRDVA